MLTTRRVVYRLVTLGVLTTALLVTDGLAPQAGNAQLSDCAFEVYDYCFSQSRPVDTSSCTCNTNACMGIPESDCTEQGMYLDTSRCVCVANPSYIGYCDNDPYALGCPRSFDTVFG